MNQMQIDFLKGQLSVRSGVLPVGVELHENQLRVRSGVKLTEPLYLKSQNSETALLLIQVEAGASVKIFEETIGETHEKIILSEGAHLNWVWLDSEKNAESSDFTQNIELQKDAELQGTTLHLGAGKIVWNSEVQFLGSGSKMSMISAVLGNGKRSLKFYQKNDHLVPDTESALELYSVMKDESQADFSAMIRIAETAARTEAYQKNKNLMLSRRAQVLALPQLEIETDDVKCAHGASMSAVDETQLYYLQTRGISLSEAENMIISGILEPIRVRAGLSHESELL